MDFHVGTQTMFLRHLISGFEKWGIKLLIHKDEHLLTPYPKAANEKMLPFMASCKWEFEYLSNILMLIRIIKYIPVLQMQKSVNSFF